MKVYVRLSGEVRQLDVDEVIENISSRSPDGDIPPYLIACFKGENSTVENYLLTVCDGELRRYLLMKDLPRNICFPIRGYSRYGSLKELSPRGSRLVNSDEKGFLHAQDEMRFTHDRNFFIPIEALITKEEVDLIAPNVDGSEFDLMGDMNGEDPEVTFPFLEESILTQEQQRHLYFDPVISGCGRFYLTLMSVSELSEKAVASVLLNDAVLQNLELAGDEKKYIEAQYLPFFELDKINTIENMSDVTIGAVLYYYQYCVFCKLGEIGSDSQGIANDSMRDYSHEYLSTLVGSLPGQYQSDSSFWEKPVRQQEQILVSPNAEVFQCLGLIFGVNAENFFIESQRRALIQEYMQRYSIAELENIQDALSDYKKSLEDETGQTHFRMEFEEAYRHLNAAYPIPERVSQNGGMAHRHSPSNFSAWVEEPVEDVVGQRRPTRRRRFVPLFNFEHEISGRERFEILVNNALEEVNKLRQLMSIEAKIKNLPEDNVSDKELLEILGKYSVDRLKNLMSPHFVQRVLSMMHYMNDIKQLYQVLGSEKRKGFLEALFENFPSSENIYFFLSKLNRTERELIAKFIPMNKLLRELKNKGDLKAVFQYLPMDVKDEVVKQLVDHGSLPGLVSNMTEFETIVLITSMPSMLLHGLREKFVTQMQSRLSDIVNDIFALIMILKNQDLMDGEKDEICTTLKPNIPHLFRDFSDFKLFITCQDITDKHKWLVTDALIHANRLQQFVYLKREFDYVLSLYGRYYDLNARRLFILQISSRMAAIITNHHEFVQLMTSGALTTEEKETCFSGLKTIILRYVTTVRDFVEISSNVHFSSEIKKQLFRLFLDSYNSTLAHGNHNPGLFPVVLRRDLLVFLSGVYMISFEFRNEGGEALALFVNTSWALFGADEDSVVENIAQWGRLLSGASTYGMKYAISKYIDHWQAGNQSLNVSQICAQGREVSRGYRAIVTGVFVPTHHAFR